MLILGYFILMLSLVILFGWLFPVLSGIVRIRKRTGGKVRLAVGAIWGLCSLLLIIHSVNSAMRFSRQYHGEEFDPAAYEGPLGRITIPHKGESTLALSPAKDGKTLRFHSSDGIFSVPPGDYSISSWTGTVTATDKDKAVWTASSYYYSRSERERKNFTVTPDSPAEFDDAFFRCFKETPVMKITTRPDPKKKGNTGIGLDVTAGGQSIDYLKDGKPPAVTIEIKDKDGRVVHKDTSGMDKFVFG